MSRAFSQRAYCPRVFVAREFRGVFGSPPEIETFVFYVHPLLTFVAYVHTELDAVLYV